LDFGRSYKLYKKKDDPPTKNTARKKLSPKKPVSIEKMDEKKGNKKEKIKQTR